ncbi:hypothetical protein PV318_00095 [Streptomyces sp. ME02-6991-2B]|nr:hypothetical protein [Streptomyces sp. ME02-6991-2B]
MNRDASPVKLWRRLRKFGAKDTWHDISAGLLTRRPSRAWVEQWVDVAVVDASTVRFVGSGRASRSLIEEHNGAAVGPLLATRDLRLRDLHVPALTDRLMPDAGSVARVDLVKTGALLLLRINA